jgi:hypothetical protein
MLRPCHIIVFLAPILASGACAQTAFENGYDCWIGNTGGLDTTHYVRCIADRDHLSGSVSDGELMLDRIHSLLHLSAVGDVERLVQSNPDLRRSGRVRSVALYSYPAEWSWADGMPQKLVSSAWCALTDNCRISMFRR